MKISFFTMPLHPPKRNYVETLKEDRAAILLADELGFVDAFIGEHVTDIAETVTSSLMFCASLVHDTTPIELGSGTVDLPNNHPAQVAVQVACDLTPRRLATSARVGPPCLPKLLITFLPSGRVSHRIISAVSSGKEERKKRLIERLDGALFSRRIKNFIRPLL